MLLCSQNKMKVKENKSLFLEQFGDTPQLRIIDFFIDNHFFDFPLTEIAKESNVSYNSLKMILPRFIKNGIIYKTRRIGKSDYYKLNIENPFVKSIIKLDWMLVEKSIEKEKEYQVEIFS